jgi:hypothetical protein
MYWDISVAEGFARKLNVFPRIFEVILPSALPFWRMQLAFFCGKGSIYVQEFLTQKKMKKESECIFKFLWLNYGSCLN